MKIGILTFHYAHNYGAVLQCYALQTYLQQLGHDVRVIDYRLPYIEQFYKKFKIHNYLRKNLLKAVKELFLYQWQRIRRYHNVENFILTHLNLAPVEEILSIGFDTIVIGSDQVWNKYLTDGLNDYYWGKFKKNPNTRLISYAASIGQMWSKEDNKEVCVLLSNFDAIGIREEYDRNMIRNLYGDGEIEVCVDPTLLVNRDWWDSIAEKPNIKEPYLFLYMVRQSPKLYTMAKTIAKERRLKLVCLSCFVGQVNSCVSACACPAQFLGLFKYASLVLSSSFHGTVFSMIFARPFYTIRLNDGKDSRVESLINLMGLESHFVSDVHSEDSGVIDATYVANKIQQISEGSKKYLLKNI